jgi:hypothetical protein
MFGAKKGEMIRLKTGSWVAAFFGALVVCAGSAHATDIGGTISATVTITEDSQLVDDVTCTVTGAPCIAIGAPNVTLDLNGFTMTGPADPQVACAASPGLPITNASGEAGIFVSAQKDVVIRGPGLVQQFRNFGILLLNSTSASVKGVTMSNNCFSGVILIGGSDHLLEGNISVGNGAPSAPCGGI